MCTRACSSCRCAMHRSHIPYGAGSGRAALHVRYRQFGQIKRCPEHNPLHQVEFFAWGSFQPNRCAEYPLCSPHTLWFRVLQLRDSIFDVFVSRKVRRNEHHLTAQVFGHLLRLLAFPSHSDQGLQCTNLFAAARYRRRPSRCRSAAPVTMHTLRQLKSLSTRTSMSSRRIVGSEIPCFPSTSTAK